MASRETKPKTKKKTSNARKITKSEELDINKDEFKKLCMIQCTAIEIASFFDCSTVTLDKWVAKNFKGKTLGEVIKDLSKAGLVSLRRAQWLSAMNGNVTMQIWLGKNLLNQKDEIHTYEDDENIIISYDVGEQRYNETIDEFKQIGKPEEEIGAIVVEGIEVINEVVEPLAEDSGKDTQTLVQENEGNNTQVSHSAVVFDDVEIIEDIGDDNV